MSRQYWEEKLHQDYENWIIYDDSWINYWDKKENKNYEVDIITCEKKGFIILTRYKNEKKYLIDNIKNYLFFGYVCGDSRRQGVLRKLMIKLKEKYKDEDISLSSLDETTDKVWSKMGFRCIKKREKNNMCSQYVSKPEIN